ncbi:glycosyltransferase [Coprothermobacteraceae bacterium]|nr:glycosyltransferase [Coprothermobacteraceae bacterium]
MSLGLLTSRTLVSVNKMYYPEIGGVENVAKEIAEASIDLFDKSVVITFNKTSKRVTEEINSVAVIRLATWLRRDPIRFSPQLCQALKSLDEKDNVFVFHFPSFQPELYFLHSDLEGKKVCFYHSDIAGRGILGALYRKIVVRKFLSKMDAIVVTSPKMAQTSNDLKGHEDKILVIPLFVDLDHFYPRPKVKRAEIFTALGVQDQAAAKLVLYVGRFGRYKGLEYLVRAMKLLPENYYLVLIGNGPRRSLIESEIIKLNLVSRVLLLNHVPYSELPYYYSAADVFVLPSVDRGEAFGLVAIEAMACGVPVITTELGTGTSYHNIDGVTGRVVLPKDETALARAILDVTQSKTAFEPNGLRARAEGFSKSEFRAKWRRLLEQLITSERWPV